MARSKNNKKMKGGVWYDLSTWGSTKSEEDNKEKTSLLNQSASTESSSEEPAKETSGLSQSSDTPAAAAPAQNSWLQGITGGKSKKAKKRKANKTKKSKK